MEWADWLMQRVLGKNLENYVEDATVKNAQEMFQQYGFKPLNEKTYDS